MVMVWSLIGNERAVSALAGAVASGGWMHAYLFAGPEGVGKAALARQFAQALNCTGDEPPCGDCPQCRRIEAGIHADVFTVTVEVVEEGPQRKAISIDQVREVERLAALSPFEGRIRVVIIDPADGMTAGAQNAFLKTLEEPPPSVAFVLLATEPERLLETVQSRCQRIELRLASRQDIEAGLLERGVEAESAGLLARVAGGRPGRAIRMATEPELVERRRSAIESGRSLPRKSIRERMDLAERLNEDFKRERDGVFWLLEQWQAWWRDVLMAQSGAEEGIASVDMLEAVREDASACGGEDVAAFVRALGEARQWLAENVQSRLALEALMLKAPKSVGLIPAG